MKKSIVIIDGSNTYFKLKSLGLHGLHEFDYLSFVQKVTANTNVVKMYFCIGKIQAPQNDPKARDMMAKQQSLVTRLQKQGFTIQFGYLMQHDGKYHEKGVDIQIATNLLVHGLKNEYDEGYIVSSDSDLIPAINAVQESGKDVIYVGFKHQPSMAMLKSCHRSILLTASDI